MMIQIKKIGQKTREKRNNFKGVLRNLNSLKKRDVKVEIERNKNRRVQRNKKRTQSQKTNKKQKNMKKNNNRDKIKNRLEIKRGQSRSKAIL